MSNPDFALAESVSTTNASYFICVYILVLIYCCFALAVVCDVYFVPALQKLSLAYNLPPDIAGSTLMALGASVPELFASLIGVFITEDDIGTGSIIGSSCFNLIAVPAACAFVASASFSRKLILTPMPVIRNSAFYAITILVLLLIIKDNKVDIPEALILLLFFVMYMALMIFSVQSKKKTSVSSESQHSLTSSYISADSAIAECNSNSNSNNSSQNKFKSTKGTLINEQQDCGHLYFAKDSHIKMNYNSFAQRTPLVTEASHLLTNQKQQQPQLQLQPQNQISVPIDQLLDSYYHQQQQPIPDYTLINVRNNNNLVTFKGNNDELFGGSDSFELGIAIKNSTCLAQGLMLDDDDDNTATQTDRNSKNFSPDSICDDGCEKYNNYDERKQHEENWVSSNWILVPLLPLTLSMKVLTPCKFKNSCWTIWTFLVSITLIGGLTYISVWMVHLFGKTVGIPETVSGMTILSWGTGIPELIASIVLIKKTAQADMAICNTIGSNVIDISFCLSVPWIVKCLLNKSAGLSPQVTIQSFALPWSSFALLVSVFLLILIFKLHNWELNCSVGIWLTLVYITFVGAATFLEGSYSETGIDLMSII